MTELSKLQQSPDSVRFYVIAKVLRDSTFTERAFRAAGYARQAELTELAFYIAALRRAGRIAWPPAERAILETFVSGRAAKDVVVDYERSYFRNYKRWPDIVAVDVDTLNSSFLDETIIR